MKTNEVLETIKARRSVREYDRKQIPADDLNAILEAGAYAPSGMHYETWHFTAVCNTVKLEELNERIKGAFAKSDDKHLRERGHSETYCCYYHAPTLVIVSNEPKQWWAGMDCACAIENMFLAAKNLQSFMICDTILFAQLTKRYSERMNGRLPLPLSTTGQVCAGGRWINM